MAHQAVSAASGSQGRKGAGVDAIEKRRGILSLDIDLAQCRGVENADAGARGQSLTLDGLLDRFPFPEIAIGPLPLADILEVGAVAGMPGMHRRPADGIVELASGVDSGKGADGDRRIEWAECRVPDSGNAAADMVGKDGKAVDIRRLALVGSHAGGRVALEVLHRDIVFPGGERHVGGGDVVLQVVEGLAVPR